MTANEYVDNIVKQWEKLEISSGSAMAKICAKINNQEEPKGQIIQILWDSNEGAKLQRTVHDWESAIDAIRSVNKIGRVCSVMVFN